jgi:phosphate transport system substrate-binding protein
MNRNHIIAGVLALAVARAGAQDTVTVDPNLPAYQKTSGVSGALNSVGSDTMNNLMTLWAEGFAKFYPNVKVQVEGKGSSTAPAALIARTAQLGPMSRPMKNTEIDQFEGEFGYKPLAVRTSLDSLAVYVNKDNPITALTMPQVDAIFSKARLLGAKESITQWGQVGLAGEWAAKPVSLYGRNSASGTYGFFKEHALANGDFKDEVKEQPGSASVVQGVTEDLVGVGYSGIGYRTSGVKAVALAPKEGAAPIQATPANVYNGSYPLARALFVYINKDPEKPLDPLMREFMIYVLSREGQEVVIKDGYLPLPAAVAAEELQKIRAAGS